MAHKRENPFLFAGGVPRSGTTLLQRILNNHPELAVANDSHFIPRALELTDKSLLNDAVEGKHIPLTPDLVDNVRKYHRFYRMELSTSDFETAASRSRTYQDLVSNLYDQFASNSGKILAGEKTPDYLRRFRLLNNMFPTAKLIHLVRDGRNVALSLMQWAKPDKGPGKIELWDKSQIAVCALWWRWMAMEGREQSTTIPRSAYTEIRYEQLTAEPTETTQGLCSFLGIEFSPQMVEYHRGKSRPSPGASAKSAWLAPQTGLRNWQRDMDEQQIEIFEALAADALETCGYELKNTNFSNQVKDIAATYKAWWSENFMSKHRQHVEHPVAANNAATESVEVDS